MRHLALLDLALRFAVAAGAALLLGLEREVRGHAAGVRTHVLVAAGATLFTLAGAYGFADLPRPNVDPARIAAQVANGIGFLGAGAILRQGLGVRGLTTAATLWLAAALGVASGQRPALPARPPRAGRRRRGRRHRAAPRHASDQHAGPRPYLRCARSAPGAT